MATQKILKLKEDAHRKHLEDSILEILEAVKKLQEQQAQMLQMLEESLNRLSLPRPALKRREPK